MELTADEARGMLWEDMPEGVEVIYDKIIDNRRWSIDHEIVIKKDGKFYMDTYSVGATESQDESPWEYSEPNFVEVFPHEETITVYRKEN